ncbi:UNVERIFIED_CONTAM: hypothetical protein Sindi_0752500 [Sesamum indicum]
MTYANITANINSIPMLNASNFKSWKENLEIVLGVMDLDLALREDSPSTLIDKSTSEEKREKKRWGKSNHMYLMIMKTISEAFRGTMSKILIKAKDFLADIEKRFVKNEKAEIGLVSASGSNIMNSYHILFKKRQRLKQDKIENAYLASTSKGKDKGKKRKKENGAVDIAPHKKQQKEPNYPKAVYYFCKAEGHIKKHYTNYYA